MIEMNETSSVVPISYYLCDKVSFKSWPFAVKTVLKIHKACLLNTCNICIIHVVLTQWLIIVTQTSNRSR